MVAPGIAEVESAAPEQLGARRRQRLAGDLQVVDDEAEVAGFVGRLRATLGDREELVAHVEEGHPRDAAAELELKRPPVELERRVEVVDLDRDVVDADQPRARHPLIVTGSVTPTSR